LLVGRDVKRREAARATPSASSIPKNSMKDFRRISSMRIVFLPQHHQNFEDSLAHGSGSRPLPAMAPTHFAGAFPLVSRWFDTPLSRYKTEGTSEQVLSTRSVGMSLARRFNAGVRRFEPSVAERRWNQS
jgi:hypothetical protein